MTGRTYRTCKTARAVAALALALSPALAAAQDGDFDLRRRGGQVEPPQPTVVGPSDPDNPTPRPRRTAPPPQPIVLPSAAPTPSTAIATPTPRPATVTASPPQARPRPVERPATSVAADGAAGPVATPPAAADGPQAAPSTRPTPRIYQPRDLDLVAESTPVGLWLALAALAGVLAAAGWLAWSRYFKPRGRAVALPEIERPYVPPVAPRIEPSAPAANDQPIPAPQPVRHEALGLVLQATRLSATLVATTLSYRLSITNNGAAPLHDLRIDGDMIAAHASRPKENVIGHNAAMLPPLHRVATLAPGESVTLGGDIRLPLVAITPIRSGNAAFFVPLARMRARGTAPTGVTVEGGGTFLVGQEPGANRKLQPFRLDLGPRNYSQLGQHLLPAA